MDSRIRTTEQVGVCDVHRLANNDFRLRKVMYCGLCDAWICKDCSPNLPKRAYAMLIKKSRGE